MNLLRGLRGIRRRTAAWLALLGVSLPCAGGAAAQVPKEPQTRPAVTNAADAELLVLLVRGTLLAVHQANVTGNYTVLRDLGAAAFRDKLSAGDLAVIFAPIKQRNVDLGAVVLLGPQLSQATLDPQNRLRIAGTLATKPVPVSFELIFQPEGGTWRILAVAVEPHQSVAAISEPLRKGAELPDQASGGRSTSTQPKARSAPATGTPTGKR